MAPLKPALIGLLAVVVSRVSAQATSDRDFMKYGPWQLFKTEPDFQAAVLSSTVQSANQYRLNLSDEHILFTIRNLAGPGPWGPQIFDSDLNLVYFSAAHVTDSTLAYQDPHICSYWQDEAHSTNSAPRREYEGSYLCANDALTQTQGHLEVIPRIYDSSYKVVKSFDAETIGNIGDLGISDGHEFTMLPSGDTYLSTVYSYRRWNISDLPFEGRHPFVKGEDPDGLDWVYDGCFREVNIKEKHINFQWCFLDHFPITDTFLPLERQPTRGSPFDCAHINSVDKNVEGDYIVSFKYMSQLVKIAGPDNKVHAPGTTIWRLGGKNGNVTIHGDQPLFAFQHHVRFVSAEFETNSDGQRVLTSELVSIFDNHCSRGVVVKGCDISNVGLIIRIDYTDRQPTASLYQRYEFPGFAQSWAGGNLQILDNGNVWVGWSLTAEGTEYDFESGRILQHITLSASRQNSFYRATRGKWIGKPEWAPKAFVEFGEDHSRSDHPNPMISLYVSWNGATEVKRWHVWTSEKGRSGPWDERGVFDKDGFETFVQFPLYTQNTLEKRTITEPRDLQEDHQYTGRHNRMSSYVTNSGLTRKAKKENILYVQTQALDKDGKPLPYGAVVSSVTVPDRYTLSSGKDDDKEENGNGNGSNSNDNGSNHKSGNNENNNGSNNNNNYSNGNNKAEGEDSTNIPSSSVSGGKGIMGAIKENAPSTNQWALMIIILIFIVGSLWTYRRCKSSNSWLNRHPSTKHSRAWSESGYQLVHTENSDETSGTSERSPGKSEVSRNGTAKETPS